MVSLWVKININLFKHFESKKFLWIQSSNLNSLQIRIYHKVLYTVVLLSRHFNCTLLFIGISLCSSGWLETHSVDHVSLELRHPPSSTSHVVKGMHHYAQPLALNFCIFLKTSLLLWLGVIVVFPKSIFWNRFICESNYLYTSEMVGFAL